MKSLLIILSLSSFLLDPAASTCAPRSAPYDRVLNNYLPPPSSAPSPSPSPSPSRAPTPSHLPSYVASHVHVPTHVVPSHVTASAADPAPLVHAGGMSNMIESISSVSDSVSSAINSLNSAFLDGSVKSICEKTDHPDVCASSIQSVAPNLKNADANTVLKLAIKGAMVTTRAALTIVNGLASQASDKLTKSILDVCSNGFEDAINDLQDAEKAVDAKDKGTMKSMLSALFSDYGGCGDAYTDLKRTSPMKAYEDLLTQHASNCLAIGDLIN